MSDFDAYYAENPVERWDKQRWNEFDAAIAVNFHQSAVFTPLIAWQPMEGLAPVYTTGREALPGHVNHNSIGLRQRYINAAYTDSRERQLTADSRYGAKVQYDHYDELINMWKANGRRGFIDGILNQHLNMSILGTHENLAKQALVTNVNVKTYAGGATSFAGLGTTSDYKFDIKNLRDIKLRLSVRAKFSTGQFGSYGNPVPGNNDMLIVTTPGVMFDLYDQMNGEWMQDLRDLQDSRIINGGAVRYNGFTFVETWDAALFGMGNITKQVAVTAAINAGDGAPDPDSTKIDNTYAVGQSGAVHYVQCSDLGTGQFAAGDFVVLHTARTDAYGVTDGANSLDGESTVLEVYSVDETNERLAFRSPVMSDYTTPFNYTTLAGSASAGTAYAFITKAQHVNPIFFVGARGSSLFAIRRKLALHVPPAIDDFESVVRVSWDEYGGMNKWNGDLYEIHYAAASFANRGSVAVA